MRDEERPLTKDGRADAKRLGQLLRAAGRKPDLVVASPARRAADTAMLVYEAWSDQGKVTYEPSLYRAGLDGIATVVGSFSSEVGCAMVVGHDPAVSGFLAQLVGKPVGLPAGGLAELAIQADAWSRVGQPDSSAELVRLLRPLRQGVQSALRDRADDRRKRSKWFFAVADERVSDAAARAVELRLEDVLVCLTAVAEATEDDGEAVRKLRVSTRRAEAAMRAFRDVLPRRAVSRVREHLRGVRRSTNAVRDADAMLARLAPIAPADLVAVLRAQRHAAEHEVRALCRRTSADAAFARSIAVLGRKAREGRADDEATAIPFGAWARRRLAAASQRFFAATATDVTDVEQLHALRLRVKKLRYEIEILSCVCPPSVRTGAYPTLTRLQDYLGEVNDWAVTLQRLARLARSAPAAPPFDRVVRDAGDSSARARSELVAWWTPERAERLRSTISERA